MSHKYNLRINGLPSLDILTSFQSGKTVQYTMSSPDCKKMVTQVNALCLRLSYLYAT